MKVIDASSIVLAWDTYPIDQFPTFWEWIKSRLVDEKLVMAEPNYSEVGFASPDCQHWLSAHLSRLPVTNHVVIAALQINNALGIVNGQYHPSGVDENDVFCIASAKVQSCSIISDEAIQPVPPGNI